MLEKIVDVGKKFSIGENSIRNYWKNSTYKKLVSEKNCIKSCCREKFSMSNKKFEVRKLVGNMKKIVPEKIVC